MEQIGRLEALLPILYPKDLFTGEFDEASVALLGKNAGGLSASTIGGSRMSGGGCSWIARVL